MSRPPSQRTRVASLLTAAKDEADLTWLDVETATGVRRPTREGWFRRSTRQPPLGPIVLMADYLGVDPVELFAAVLADHAISATSNDPAENPSATQDLADAHAARDAEVGARKQRRRRRRPSSGG